MKDESEVQQEIQIDGPSYKSVLMRNNSGAFKDQTGRVVFYGLGNTSKKRSDKIKSSDLVGFTETLITPDMVGRTVAIFTAVEVKKEAWNSDKKLDKHELAQKAFLDWVKVKGGFAGFANSVESFRKILGL